MRCPHCAAALGADAAWCGLCLAPVERAAVATVTRPPAPAWPSPMPAPPAPASQGRAGRTVGAAIAVGVVAQAVTTFASRGAENEAAIRYALVTTLAVYAVVAVLLIRRRAGENEPLDWRGTHHPAVSVVIGLALGGGLAAFLLNAAGQRGGDPRVALLVSEGDVAHVLATALVTVVAAPLLEELLFRGMLLHQLSRHGRRVAVWGSAVAFAAWHLAPASFLYYVLMGLLLGGLFARRGLACSIATHAAFNAVLTAAAVTYALAPGAVGQTGGLALTAPHGWHAVAEPGSGVHLTGPSGGEILAQDVALPGATTDADLVAERLARGAMPGTDLLSPRLDTIRTVRLHAGTAVRVAVTSEGRDGELVVLPHRDGVYLVLLASGGSPRVRADFDRVLRDLRTVSR